MILNILLNKSPISHRHLLRYIKFISSRPSRIIQPDQYTEKHHIIPVSMEKQYSKEKWNIVELTHREHILAHILFACAFGGKQWISVNLTMNSENPYQHRKGFKGFSTQIISKIKTELKAIQSATTKKSRKNESPEEISSRVEKWKKWKKDNPEQFLAGIEKGKATRAENDQTREPRVHKKATCDICNKEISEHSMNRHISICTRRKEEKEKKEENRKCKNCGKFPITHRHTCAIVAPTVYEEPKTCNICKEKTYTLIWQYEKHVSKCTGPAVKKNKVKLPKQPKIKVKKPRKPYPKRASKNKFKCDNCEKLFSNQNKLDLHIEDGSCMLTPEERKLRGNLRRQIANANRSQEEKEKSYKKQSETIKKTLGAMSELEKAERNKKTSESVKEYYDSERYDPQKKSEEVKIGLAKNKKH